MFENVIRDNLEGTDQLEWRLLVDGTEVDSATLGMGVDFGIFDFTMSQTPATAVTSVVVQMEITGFDDAGERFVFRGGLTASCNSAPEPIPAVVVVPLIAVASTRVRSRRCQ